MSNVWFTSDTHLGHRNIGNYRDIPSQYIEQAADIMAGSYLKEILCKANTLWFTDRYNALVRKRDVIWNSGDIAFTLEDLNAYAELLGTKNAVLGNHDDFSIQEYARVFNEVRGIRSYKGMWLTHSPVNEAELRGRFNTHGHVHSANVEDWRYINVCCENLQKEIGEPMISLVQIKQVMQNRRETRDWRVWL